MRSQLLSALICALLIGGCSSGPKFRISYLSSFDFSSVSSYSLYQRNSTFSELQNISDVTRNSIEIAIENSLDKLGYQYQLFEDADVVIGYHIVNRSNELSAYNRSVKYCRVCLPESMTGDKKHRTASHGSLIIDVINKQNNRTVWRSISQLNLREKDHSLDVQAKLENTIIAMLRNLPKSTTAR